MGRKILFITTDQQRYDANQDHLEHPDIKHLLNALFGLTGSGLVFSLTGYFCIDDFAGTLGVL